jgi:16S rRNA (guanine(1405)-N(7))-methyltransferase
VSESESNVEKIALTVAAARKYRMVCTDTIHRIAAREFIAQGSVKAATKATKRRLHQIYGAFEQDVDYDGIYPRLEASYRTGTDDEIKAACRQILGLHSSTRERLPILDRFYTDIFQLTGQPATLLDLGCGLNPLALPWMDLVARARYVPLDIDRARVRFLNRYLVLAGLQPLARLQDILSQPPTDRADVALLLKMGPTLERQEQGATLRLIDQLQSSFVVVSFAIQSLAGRKKGMQEHYEQQFLDRIRDHSWTVQKKVYDTELVLVLGPFF